MTLKKFANKMKLYASAFLEIGKKDLARQAEDIAKEVSSLVEILAKSDQDCPGSTYWNQKSEKCLDLPSDLQKLIDEGRALVSSAQKAEDTEPSRAAELWDSVGELADKLVPNLQEQGFHGASFEIRREFAKKGKSKEASTQGSVFSKITASLVQAATLENHDIGKHVRSDFRQTAETTQLSFDGKTSSGGKFRLAYSIISNPALKVVGKLSLSGKKPLEVDLTEVFLVNDLGALIPKHLSKIWMDEVKWH